MTNPTFDSQSESAAIAQSIRTLAHHVRGDSTQLLALLRLLESLHQEIRDGLFQEALPESRQALYHLLKEIEANGGWPYIHRMRLQDLIQNFSQFPLPDSDAPIAPDGVSAHH